MMPLEGIYATRVRIGDEIYMGVTNVGVRPTVDTGKARVNCETHLLDFDRDLYGRTVTVEFVHRIRDEQRFESLDALKAAILQDANAAKEYFEKVSV